MYVIYKTRLLKRRLFRVSEGERVLKKSYKDFFGKDLEIEKPLGFSEKLFRKMIMLNRHPDPRLTRLADKYAVREYIKEVIGEKYLINLIWHGTDPRRIPFDSLPAKCIVKTNHGSGSIIKLTENGNRKDVIKRLRGWLGENFYWAGRECQYLNIKPRVLVEELLDDGERDGPLDYRFWCFDGKIEVIQVDNHTHSINSFFDIDWNKLPLHYRQNAKDSETKIPENYQEMLQVASKLCAGFDFVRIDLYNIFGRVYFGEFTFTPVGGRLKIKPESWNRILGEKWIMAT